MERRTFIRWLAGGMYGLLGWRVFGRKNKVSTRRTLFTDNFNRANGALGANWDYDATHDWYGNIAIQSNAVAGQGGSLSAMSALCVQALPAEQWAELKYVGGLPTETGDYNIGVYTRMDLAENAYLFELQTFSGIWTLIDTGGSTIATNTIAGISVGDVIRFEAQGGELRLYVNDVLKVTVTDPATRTMGFSGFFFYGQNDTDGNSIPVIDDFACGDWTEDEAVEEPMIFVTT